MLVANAEASNFSHFVKDLSKAYLFNVLSVEIVADNTTT